MYRFGFNCAFWHLSFQSCTCSKHADVAIMQLSRAIPCGYLHSSVSLRHLYWGFISAMAYQNTLCKRAKSGSKTLWRRLFSLALCLVSSTFNALKRQQNKNNEIRLFTVWCYLGISLLTIFVFLRNAEICKWHLKSDR